MPRTPSTQAMPADYLAVVREFFADGLTKAGKKPGPINHEILRHTRAEWLVCCEENLDDWQRHRSPETAHKERHRLGVAHRAHRVGLDPRLLRRHVRRVRDLLLGTASEWALLDAILPLGVPDARIRLYFQAGLSPAEAVAVEADGPTEERLDALRVLASLAGHRVMA